MASLAWMASTALLLAGGSSGCGGAQDSRPASAPATLASQEAPSTGSASDAKSGAASTAAQAPGEPAAEPPSPSEVASRTIDSLRDAFNAHDADKVAEQYTPDCVVETYTGPALHGRSEVADDARRTFAGFGDAKTAPLRGWVKDHVVVSEVAWTGTQSGEYLGIKPGGKPVGLVALRVLHLTDDGHVAEAHEYADAAGLVAQMAGKRWAPPPPILPVNDLALHVAKDSPDEDKLAAWAKGLDDVYATENAKNVAATVSDGADYWTNFGGPAVKGKRAIEKSLTAWFKAFPDQKWESKEAWGVDGFAIVEHTMTGTQKGALPVGAGAMADGLVPYAAYAAHAAHRASNKPVTGWRRVDILQPAAEGTVLHGWGFTNVMEMLQQTGAIKAPADLTTTKPAPPLTQLAHKKSVPAAAK
ncbi:MAG: ester cyclase [Polyangiaceae bacterium]